MKFIYYILIFIFPIFDGYCQSEKVVTLSVSGQGKSIDEAKNIALRSALELAFGTFISSRTEIFNDELIGDEIVSLASGNIQDFKIISQTQLSDGSYTVSLNATVSVSKLTSFVQNKGIEIEFKGGLFAENIKIQKLNEDAEYKAVLNLIEISNKILSNSLDFEVVVGEPTLAADLKNPLTGQSLLTPGSEDLYSLSIIVKATPNKNYENFRKYFTETINSLNMKEIEIQEYNKINKKLFILINKDNLVSRQGTKTSNLTYLRNPKTSIALQSFFIKSNRYLTDFNLDLLNLGTYDVVLCCSDDSNVIFSHTEGFGWELNYQEGNNGFITSGELIDDSFPNFNFVYMYPHESGSWGYYLQMVNAINQSNDINNYSLFTNDLLHFNHQLIFDHVDPNPYFLPPSSDVYLNKSDGSEDKGKSIIGVFNSVKNAYYHKSILYLNLKDLEKITGFNIKPRNN